jgi:anti-sigma B factor antagonist
MTAVTIESTFLARDVVCLAVAGEIDMDSAEAVDEAIRAALGVAGIEQVLIDMDRTTFLDSVGIRTLLEGHELASEQGVTFRVVNPHDIVRRVLDLTGVLRLLIGNPDQ